MIPISSVLFPILLPVAGAVQAAPRPSDAKPESGVAEDALAGLEFRSIGPAFMSGRISDIDVHPGKQSTWYVSVGSGGVWKTVNAGTTWTPIFEDQPSYSIGCLTIDPSAPETIWVGTGENVSGRHVGFGDGVYRSLDGGATFEPRGLEASEHVGSIVVHPEDSGVVWVAAQGPLWTGGGERGVYKTEDGGLTWNCTLSAGPYTGAGEVIMDPDDPNVLYAALHQRQRTVAALMDGGPESGIHKSTDGGETWTKLTGGLPTKHVGKIGLAISPFDTRVVYATIEEGERKGGFWRSTDGGASWTKQSDYLSGGTGPHYYQEIFASPHATERVYQMDVWLHVSDDGGQSFHQLGHGAKHSDNHAIAFDPNDPDYLLVGCDGGLYQSWDHGATWKFAANLPVTQFYKVAVDDALPFYNVYGGTQDNSSESGPSRTLNAHGITNADWSVTLFADGHDQATEPGNPNIAYAEWQQGNLMRFDRATGELVYVKPQPEADAPEERFNWDAPILVSRHDPARVYFASQRVWRSDSRGDDWTAISGDLSHGIDRFRKPIMGEVWGPDAAWDTLAMSRFGTITSLAESAVDAGVLWAGTDDGRLHVTENGGESWRAIDALPGVPASFFVNAVKADRFDRTTAYVVVDDHKNGDYAPYVLKTADLGATWTRITSGIPDRHVAWRIVQDHVDPNLLFLGTEFGVFCSMDGGAAWQPLQGGMPTIPVRDLEIQERENDLVCATFGRGIYILDDYTSLRGLSADVLSKEAELFPVRNALWYLPKRPLGAGAPLGKAFQGDAFYVAPNPDFGAVFTYHLAQGYRTAAELRDEANDRARDGEGTAPPAPGFDEFRRERDEPKPAVVLTILDASGDVVTRIEGPATKGFHRVAWNLRRPDTSAWQREVEDDEWDDGGDTGALCAPGTYTVRFGTRVAGQFVDLGLQQSFVVEPLGGGSLPGATPEAFAAFRSELAEASRVLSATAATLASQREKVSAIRSVLGRTPALSPELGAEVQGLEDRLAELQRQLSGDELLENANEAGPMSIRARLSIAELGTEYSTYGPTPNHRKALAIATSALDVVVQEIRSIGESDLARLDAALDAARAPWTPGRSPR
ncbi:VPS10 domain-containing protein [Planctomycetes bacterium Poly30]|uniref:VPS10 domain-containing protein n=1 Tax=Saltatorellus ferox TaxID=2528018 RepID=UPI0011A0A4E3